MPSRTIPRFPTGLSFILLAALLAVLWLAGGASRADALGQVLVRGAAWFALILALLFGARPSFAGTRPLLVLLIAAALLALVQLIPLPPDIWQAFPGRASLADAAAVSGQLQPWRPWSIVPGATANALSSLIVPAAVLVLATGLKEDEHKWLLGLVLGLVATSMLLGLLQISGVAFNNPFINASAGEVSGTFANRNHFALFLAFGCLGAPVWAFYGGQRPKWRAPVVLGLVLLFALTILATGSRAGIVLGVFALGIAMLLGYNGIRRALRRYPRWVLPALVAAIVGLVAIFIVIAVAADRAASINRMLAAYPGQDMRSRNLPTVLDMIREYFPAGSGLGGFDPVFRMGEPFALLNLTYFNHAHNDFLEVVLDAGVLGLALLIAALLWWIWASVRVWRPGFESASALPRLGSAMLLLTIIASIFDYPARTPMIMAMIVIAGVWLGNSGRGGSALPQRD